jgi:putative DNA primase/helicase
VRLVPYNLPEVLKAKSVIIVEGEKDCETIKVWGLTATTNAQGAGKWRQQYNDHLKGKRVAVLPDNDDPGRKHALEVARNVHGIAEIYGGGVTGPAGEG